MNMREAEERKKFAKEVLEKIVNDVYYQCFEEAATLVAELKTFFENPDANIAGTAMLNGRECTKNEAYDICQYMAEYVCEKCTHAGVFNWPFTVWYTVVEILKIFKKGPNEKFTWFINFFFEAPDTPDTPDAAGDTDASDASDDFYKINFIKNLELLYLLGIPSSDFEARKERQFHWNQDAWNTYTERKQNTSFS